MTGGLQDFRAAVALLLLAPILVLGARAAEAAELRELPPLPPICTEPQITAIPTADAQGKPLSALRKQVEKLIETDPNASVAIMCVTIPRVVREKGEHSVAAAWWVGSLATPLIAFMDRLAEALPLLQFAQPIFERRLGPYAAEVAEIHVAYAWIATRQGRNADATAAWKDALRIRERTPGAKKIELQKVLVGLAQTESMLRNFAEARDALERARTILVENGETVSDAAAAIETSYINVAWREEDFAGARKHAETQIRIEEQMGGPAAQRVPAYVWLGRSLERLDELEAAEAALRKAVEISESQQDAPLQRHHFLALERLAGLLVTRGKPAEAREIARQSIALGEQTRGADAPLLIQPLQYLGEAEGDLGELPEAMRDFERAGAIIEKNPNDVERPFVVAQYSGLARLQIAVGEREQARASLASALQAVGTDPTLTVDRAGALLALGGLTPDTDTGAGRAALAESLALYRLRLPESHPAILRVIAEACTLEMQAEPDSAPSCDEIATRLERSHDVDPFLRHDIYAVWSELSHRRGDPVRAYDLAIRALSAAAALGTPDPLWRANFALARLERDRNDPTLAIFLGKEALTQIERLRGRFVGEDRGLERGFLEDKVGVYRTVADWLMEAGRIDEGLDVLRLLKAQELYDFILRDAQWSREDGVELTGTEQALRQRYQESVGADAQHGSEMDRLGRLQESGRISTTERRQFQTLIADEQQQEAARVARIREFLADSPGRLPTYVREREVKVQQLARERASLGPDAALAFYLLTDKRLRVFVATRLGQYEYVSSVDGPALKRQIGQFLEAIGRREDVHRAARSLYLAIAKPVDDQARRAGAKRLVLWLDGALRYVPFAVLHDGDGYLVDRYAIESYASPTDDRTVLAAHDGTASTVDARTVPIGADARPVPTAVAGRDVRKMSVRGLGLTRAVAGYDALPAMADELCDVVRGPIAGLEVQGQSCPRVQLGAGALEGEGFADAAFTEARLRSLLFGEPQYSVLHLGTHFSLRPGNARRSFLVLGDGSRLTLDSIGELDFRGLQLVTLSACQSGLGGATTDDGREVEGLSAIVQRRGARHVVASLWQVEDRSTARLMREMYAALSASKMDPASALRHSQLALRALRVGGAHPYEHPYYWGGFLVSGSRD